MDLNQPQTTWTVNTSHPVGAIKVTPAPLSEDDIRRIIREELQRG